MSIASSILCPLCGSSDLEPMIVPGAPGLQQCRACEFIFAPGIESEDSGLYDSNFGDTNVHPTYEKRDGRYVVRNRAKLEALLDRMEPYRSTGRILDIGCSAAFFLHVAKERGWKPQGAEIAKWAVDFSQKELGVDVFHGMLADAKFPDGHFDVVFSSHVMEHISQPSELLREMVRVLRPGGAHVTVVPTQFASPTWKIARRFIGDPPPIHASFYTQRTYSAFLEKAGLQVVHSHYNIELTRLPSLFITEEQSLKKWREQKAEIVQGKTTAPKAKPWMSAVKSIVNWGGTLLGSGDEIVVIAVKP